MTEFKLPALIRRFVAAALLAAVAGASFGCSQELVSYDDTYVPESVDENYPIRVVERPTNLTLRANPGGFRTAEKDQIASLAHQALSRGRAPITIAYTSGSAVSRQTAGQAAALLAQEGIARQDIVLSPKQWKESAVTLSFTAKVAETKPCGDWSQTVRGTQFNDSGPNFGCAFQQNFAAMVANPEQLVQPHPTSLATSAAQRSVVDAYASGDWHAPTTDSSLSTTQ